MRQNLFIVNNRCGVIGDPIVLIIDKWREIK